MSGAPNEIPSAAEFGQWRAKMANRGIPQWWIDLTLGDNRNKPRAEHEYNMRQAYRNQQMGGPGPGTVNVPPLVTHLRDEGWNCAIIRERLIVAIQVGQEWEFIWITAEDLLTCDYTGNTPGALWNDIMTYMQGAGYCP